MCKISSSFSVSYFRHRVLAWIMLIALSFSFIPSVCPAQQPTATIRTLSGNVLVSGQTAAGGTILNAGDTIQTQAGASVVLELSDGSELHLGENTQINLADLSQTATGARVSLVKLLWGRIRAFLSPGHQQAGSSFNIETPNALVGVKFSEPDIEVSYSLEKAETVGIAHTVELIATNLLTGETKLVPVGSSVIIIGVMMKVIAGTTAAAIAAGTETAAAEKATGIGTGTKVAIGAGVAAAVGGGVALATNLQEEEVDNENVSFTGTFQSEGTRVDVLYGESFYHKEVLTLTQHENVISGTFELTHTYSCCTGTITVSVAGTVTGDNSITLDIPGIDGRCEGDCYRPIRRHDWQGGSICTSSCSLIDDGKILQCQEQSGSCGTYGNLLLQWWRQ